jgi:hypothetical protein
VDITERDGSELSHEFVITERTWLARFTTTAAFARSRIRVNVLRMSVSALFV